MKERKRNASCFLVAMKCFILSHHFFSIGCIHMHGPINILYGYSIFTHFYFKTYLWKKIKNQIIMALMSWVL